MPDIFGMMSGFGVITAVVSILITVVVLFFVFRLVSGLQKQSQMTRQLIATGDPAQAVIVDIQDTGMRINDSPSLQITLDVNSSKHGNYQVAIRTIVPLYRMMQVQVGGTVNVKIDPNNKANVALELR
jgi:hypothetical protein